jgi:hypothetical protein
MATKYNKKSFPSDASGCWFISIFVQLVILIVILWMQSTLLFFGLPTPWGKLNVDIIPPRIWDMDAVEKVEKNN